MKVYNLPQPPQKTLEFKGVLFTMPIGYNNVEDFISVLKLNNKIISQMPEKKQQSFKSVIECNNTNIQKFETLINI